MVEQIADDQSMPHRHILGLDIIRFAAAMLVAFHHLARAEVMQPYVWWGWIGVQVFFVLSGYVIAQSAKRATPFKFFRSRFVRLMPAVWICAPISFVLILGMGTGGTASDPMSLLRTLVLYPSGPWVSGVYWTLVVEVAFYILILIVVALKRFRWIEWIGYGLGVWSTIYWVAWSANWQLQAQIPLPDLLFANFVLLKHGCLFALGITLSLALTDRMTRLRLLAIASLSLVCVVQIYATATEYTSVTQAKLVPIGIWLGIMFVMVSSIRLNDHLLGWLGAHSGTVRMLGLMTYPMYLVHGEVGGFMLFLMPSFAWPYALIIAIAVALGAALLIAKSERKVVPIVGRGLDELRLQLKSKQSARPIA